MSKNNKYSLKVIHEKHTYHYYGGRAEFHHHKGFLWLGYKQRKLHINHRGPLFKYIDINIKFVLYISLEGG